MSGEEPLTEESLVAIGQAQEDRRLFVSPITAWELAVASTKARAAGRPNLGGDPPERWFKDAVSVTESKIAPIQQRISIEAAKVATFTGHKDPGDCFLIATARVRRVPLVTRDGIIRAIAADREGYLDIVLC